MSQQEEALISGPLLANIALQWYGRSWIKEYASTLKGKKRLVTRKSLSLIRYAD